MPPIQQVKKKKYHRYLLPALFLLLDYLAIVGAESSAILLHDMFGGLEHVSEMIHREYIYVWVPLVFLLFLTRSRAYKRMQPIMLVVKEVFYSIVYGLIACILLLYFFKASLLASRLYVVLFGVLVLFYIYILRYLARKVMKSYSFLPEPIILIGSGSTAEAVLKFFDEDLGYRYEVIGIIDDHPILPKLAKRSLLVGRAEQLEEIVRASGIKTVVIAKTDIAKETLQSIIAKIQPYVRNISFVPDLVGTPMAGAEVDLLFSEKIMLMKIHNNLARRRNRWIKRMFDLILSFLLCVGILPVILVLSVIIKLDSKGPVFFNAKRIGQHGETFTCYKFRSMYQESDEILEQYLSKHPAAKDEWQEFAKLRGYDPRVTNVGRWMRKYSLDELPQIFNVLLGNMSLVGPRPYLPREKADIGEENFATISLTVPGITGFWQVNGRNSVNFAGRVAMDVWYVQNWSVWVDFVYLFKTFRVVVCGKGAY